MSDLITTAAKQTTDAIWKRIDNDRVNPWDAVKQEVEVALRDQVERDARIAKKHKFNVVRDGDCTQHDCADLIATAIEKRK